MISVYIGIGMVDHWVMNIKVTIYDFKKDFIVWKWFKNRLDSLEILK